MTQIDEKSLESLLERLVYPWHRKFTCDVVAAYESARAPRTISREELAIAAKAVCDADEKSNGEASFSELAKAALATLGITVEGE